MVSFSVPSCYNPGSPVHGSLMSDEWEFSVGSIIEFQCDKDGYELNGMIIL